MTILAVPLYFDGSVVLKTSLRNATEMCARCVNPIAAEAGTHSLNKGSLSGELEWIKFNGCRLSPA